MRLLMSCGEASGDLYAGALAAELRARVPDVDLVGLGGPRLAAAGAELVGRIESLAVTGLTSGLGVVVPSLVLIRRLVRAARARRPDAVVLIDAPDFHFPLMWALRSLAIPIVYYVSPQLWAWRKGRMATMQARVREVLVIFPFEEELYQRAGVPVRFVGHPLVDLIAVRQPRGDFLAALGLTPSALTVALLPGSRRNEVRRIAPVMAAAMPRLRALVPGVQFVVAAAPGLPDSVFRPLVDGAVHVLDRTDEVLNACDVVMTASGTATVQCTLHERPMVVVYRVSAIDFRMARRFVSVKHIAMPNLLAGRRIVPELVQHDLTPERLAQETAALLTDRERRARVVDDLRVVKEQLGPPGASARAAEAVIAIARGG